MPATSDLLPDRSDALQAVYVKADLHKRFSVSLQPVAKCTSVVVAVGLGATCTQTCRQQATALQLSI